MEIWKVINGSDGAYAVSNLGRIKSRKNNKVLKGSHVGRTKKRDRTPYICHGLYLNGKRKFYLTHRIVAKYFLPNPDNLQQVNHINENVQDNRVENLEWVSNKQNSRHSNYCRIGQYDLEGNFVKYWDSLFEIGNSGFNKTHISSVLNGKRKQSQGYVWKKL